MGLEVMCKTHLHHKRLREPTKSQGGMLGYGPLLSSPRTFACTSRLLTLPPRRADAMTALLRALISFVRLPHLSIFPPPFSFSDQRFTELWSDFMDDRVSYKIVYCIALPGRAQRASLMEYDHLCSCCQSASQSVRQPASHSVVAVPVAVVVGRIDVAGLARFFVDHRF